MKHLIEIIENEIKASKRYSIEDKKITFTYLNKKFTISYSYEWEPRFGYMIMFSTKLRHHPGKRNIHIVSVSEDRVSNDKKSILLAVNKLSKRIKHQHDVNLFIDKSKDFYRQKILIYLKRKLDVNSLNINFNFNFRINFNNDKLKVNIVHINSEFEHDNIKHKYSFNGFIPSEYSYSFNENISFIKVKSHEKFFTKNVTSMIRFSKLKSIMSNG